MKNVIVLFSLMLFCSVTNAQTDITGMWNGMLNVAGNLHIVLHINKLQNGLYAATLDSPDQSASGIACDKTDVSTNTQNNTTLLFTIDKIKVSYTGVLLNDSTLSGTFTQGVNIPLDFHRTNVPYTAKVVVRPQTPVPPFPYKSEDIIYTANGLQYGATITTPQGNGPFPAVLLITGSGAQDRDETILKHKPFAVIADALTKDGFVVLRVDDRGVGSSTGNFAASTSADFANDVNASLDYLKSRPEVNDKKIGLLGHSEGAMIAPMVASQRKDVDFIILLAAPGVKITDLMAEQNAAVLKSTGVLPAVADSFKPVYKQLVLAINNAPDTTSARQNALAVINDWFNKTDSIDLHALGFISPDSKTQYINSLITVFSTAWYKYFLQF